jgi:ubiquinone/menaquinone biosynthesis C-methylase UbiE
MNAIDSLLYHNKMKVVANIFSQYLIASDTVLDVGSGDGVLTLAYRNLLKKTVVACDLVNKLKTPVKFIPMVKPDRLPFLKNAFDSVIFTDVLHHTSYENQLTLIKEALRVARINVIIYEPVKTVGVYLADVILNALTDPFSPVPLTFRNPSEWLTVIKKINPHVSYRIFPRPVTSLVTHALYIISQQPSYVKK